MTTIAITSRLPIIPDLAIFGPKPTIMLMLVIIAEVLPKVKLASFF